MERKFGALRDVHDTRDRMLLLPASVADLPPQVDLREFGGPIKDQQNLGSCTGHAGSSAREWIARRYQKTAPILSPLFLYAMELIASGDFPSDAGAMPRTLCQTLTAYGTCEDALYADASQKIESPSAAQTENALQYKTGAYHRIGTLGDFLHCLANATPWPILVGFTVYESFMTDQVAETGIMPVPAPSEETEGGHEVLCLGYDLPKRLALIQNSWGPSWGQKGYFWMPFETILRPDTDLWMVHTGSPW